uniref:Uncharacterized protein n=1 Tax=viral metagenome TaxID=1070528 RepID=A0A6C0IK00_9ZZZZ
MSEEKQLVSPDTGEITIENFDNQCKIYINDIIDKCKEDKYMRSRLLIHLKDILPNALENEYKTHKENEKRKELLEQELHSFQTYFLATNLYYFLPSNSSFYMYDGTDYKYIKEDDIIYKVLSTVTYDNKDLIDWKHKTKVSLIKKIKERTLLKHIIPETTTIQKVLNLLAPTHFRTRNEAKYFLTCIGDNILKKSNDVTFYVSPSSREKINELDKMCSIVLGINNIKNNFVSRYNENVSMQKCRLIKMRNGNGMYDSWVNILRSDGLNLLCVAVHYSTSHSSGDKFLEKRDELCDYTLFLKNNSQETIVERFCKDYIQLDIEDAINNTSKTKTTMTWRNLQYIWKCYLSKMYIPSVVYINTLKGMLIDKYKYDEATDSFLNITSRFIPVVSDFILFWTNTVTTCSKTIGNDYEVDELCSLFYKYVKENPLMFSTAGKIVEDDILNILRFYFPDIEIIANKYILNIECSLWDKCADIVTILDDARVSFQKEKELSEDKVISFDDLYKFYLKRKKGEITMSKSYFEKFIENYLKQYIVYSRVISETWLTHTTLQEITGDDL